MTIHEAITAACEEAPNNFSPELMRIWLGECEALLYNDIYADYEGAPTAAIEINRNTDGALVLSAEAPYSIIYRLWLERSIYWYRMEYDLYNAVSMRLQEEFERYAKHWNRTHVHKQPVTRWY